MKPAICLDSRFSFALSLVRFSSGTYPTFMASISCTLGSFALAKNPHYLFGTVPFLFYRVVIAATRITFLTDLIQGVIPAFCI